MQAAPPGQDAEWAAPALAVADRDNAALQAALTAPRRFALLRQLALLDSQAERAFDRLTRLACTVLRVPVALVSLVDANRQFFKSAVGLPEPWATRRETPLSHSFCKHVVASATPLVIEDAREHPLVHESPAIADLGVVAYAGMPLVTAAGEVLGSFCAIDHQPRRWSAGDLTVLTELAGACMEEIEVRLAMQVANRAAERLRRLQTVTAALSSALTPEQVAHVVLHEGLAVLGARAGSVVLLSQDGHDLEVAEAVGYDAQILEPYRRFSIDAAIPLADATRTCEAIFLESSAAWATCYPHTAAHGMSGNQAAAAVPLMVEGRVLGAVGLSFTEPQPFDPEDRDFILTLARQCGQALERARLYEAERQAHALATMVQGLAEQARQAADDQRRVAATLAAEVESHQAQLQAVVQQMPVGIILANAPSGRVLLTNTEGERILQHSVRAQDIIDYVRWPGFRPDGQAYRPEELPLARAILSGEVVRDEEVHLPRGDGSHAAVLVSATPVRDQTGAIVAGVTTFTDITAFKALDRAREEFLSSVAHDLKTPLTTMLGNAQLARRRLTRLGGPEAQAVIGQLDQIDAAALRMLDLINDLSEVARARMGQALEIERRPADLVALVREVVIGYTELTPHPITFSASPATLDALVDAPRLERVLGNLLANAIKYSPENKEIAVRLECEDGERGPEVVIAVQDHGIGIPAADLPHIFDRFHRAQNVVGHIQGTGIGLASAQQIVAQHGGRIEVESEEQVGSTFTLRLPLTRT